jgi:hypothetical protein
MSIEQSKEALLEQLEALKKETSSLEKNFLPLGMRNITIVLLVLKKNMLLEY